MESSHCAFDFRVSTDITMPGLGGLEMIREYRAWEATQGSRRRQLVYAFSGTCLEQVLVIAMFFLGETPGHVR